MCMKSICIYKSAFNQWWAVPVISFLYDTGMGTWGIGIDGIKCYDNTHAHSTRMSLHECKNIQNMEVL